MVLSCVYIGVFGGKGGIQFLLFSYRLIAWEKGRKLKGFTSTCLDIAWGKGISNCRKVKGFVFIPLNRPSPYIVGKI